MVDSQQRKMMIEEIDLFIQYGVKTDEQQDAQELLCRYQGDDPALQAMRAFYRSLPDTHEEAIVRIAFMDKKKAVVLLGVETAMHGYFYAATDESAVLLGECGQDDCDSEVLAFLGYPDAHVFFEQYSDIAACAEYEPVPEAKAEGCPICAVAVGEYHLLGCLVEVCPWCDGQFSRCACRFEQLGIEALDDEELLADLERILEEKGRIPYVIGQGPAYLSAIPDDSEDPDDFEASDE